MSIGKQTVSVSMNIEQRFHVAFTSVSASLVFLPPQLFLALAGDVICQIQ